MGTYLKIRYLTNYLTTMVVEHTPNELMHACVTLFLLIRYVFGHREQPFQINFLCSILETGMQSSICMWVVNPIFIQQQGRQNTDFVYQSTSL